MKETNLPSFFSKVTVLHVMSLSMNTLKEGELTKALAVAIPATPESFTSPCRAKRMASKSPFTITSNFASCVGGAGAGETLTHTLSISICKYITTHTHTHARLGTTMSSRSA